MTIEELPPTLGLSIRSWLRSLRARNLSAQTMASYAESARQLFDHHVKAGGKPEIEAIDKRAVEGFLIDLAARTKPTTVSVRFRALQQLFKWAVDEEFMTRSPMERMKTPAVPEVPVPVVSSEAITSLLATCAGKTFEDHRDRAIILLFVDTGVRLSENGRT